MANPEHLEIIKQGVEAWNQWRKESLPYYLSGYNLNLSNFDAVNAEIPNLNEARLEDTNLTGANLLRVDLGGAFLVNANLRGADLRGANLMNAALTDADLWNADLGEANLTGAILVETELPKADFTGANLTGANLTRANFWNADLRGAILREANLRGANLWGANLTGADLTGADFGGVELQNTVLGNLDLSIAKLLDKVYHSGPSIISVDTIFKSKGKIPKAFLRGCGFSDLQIEIAKLGTPGLDRSQITDIGYTIINLNHGLGIEFYSCFISYNNKDKEFAQKLHHDLQDNGVRCWFAPEDLKIGDKIRPRIDQEIKLRDKLLVILSNNSIKSEWVGDEVEAALEEERESDRLILFPIRLDNAILNCREDWAAKIKRRRHIGDFSNWENELEYQKAFERLLRDLRASKEEL